MLPFTQLAIISLLLISTEVAADSGQVSKWQVGIVVLIGYVAAISAMFAERINSRMLAQRHTSTDNAKCDSKKYEFRSMMIMGAFGIWLAFLSDWPLFVEQNCGGKFWVLADEALVVFPFATLIVIFRALEGTFANNRFEWRELIPDIESDSFRVQVAFGVPVVSLILARDLVVLFVPLELQSGLVLIVASAVLTGLLIVWPEVLRYCIGAEPLERSIAYEAFHEMVASEEVRFDRVYLWKTSGKIVNAMAVGFAPGWRYLFVTDGLLARLDRQEILAILLHENGHRKNHHNFFRLITFVCGITLSMHLTLYLLELTNNGVETSPYGGTLFILVQLLVGGVMLGWVSHVAEFDADREAILAMMKREPVETVLEVYARALHKMALASGSTHSVSWLHPSSPCRLDRLVAAVEQGARPTFRLFSWQAVCIVGLLTTASHLAIWFYL